jgi:hypothetical protein
MFAHNLHMGLYKHRGYPRSSSDLSDFSLSNLSFLGRAKFQTNLYIYTYIIFVCLRLCTCIPDVYLIYVRISVYIYITICIYIYYYMYIYYYICVYIYIYMWTGLQYDYCPSDWLTHVDMIVLSLSLSRTCLSCVSLFSDKPNKYHTLGHVSCISDIRLIPIKSTHSLLLKIPFLWGTLPCYILLVDSRFPTVD